MIKIMIEVGDWSFYKR